MRKQILIVDSDDRQIRRIAGVVKETAVQSGNRMEIYVANTLEEAGIIIENTFLCQLFLFLRYQNQRCMLIGKLIVWAFCPDSLMEKNCNGYWKKQCITVLYGNGIKAFV